MKKFWQIKNQSNEEVDLLIYDAIGEGNNPKELALAINNIKAPVLNIRINSGGGDLFAGQAIYNIIKGFNGLKRVYIDGIAASAASIIAMAGGEIIIPSNTLLMIHNAQALSYGDSQHFNKLANDLNKMNSTLVAVYQQKTGLEANKIQEMLDNETWLSANEALELGFVTQVVDAMDIVAKVTSNKFFLNGIFVETNNIKNKSRLQQFFKDNSHGNNCSDGTNANNFGSATDIINSYNSTSSFTGNNDTTDNTSDIYNNNNFFTKENNVAKNITLESFKQEYTGIYNEIFNAGIETGIQVEKARLKAIDELAITGHKELIYSAKYTKSISPEILALQVLKAEQALKTQYLADTTFDAEILNKVKATDAPLTSVKDIQVEELATLIANKINAKGVR